MDAKSIEKRIAVLQKRRNELRSVYHTALDRSFVEKNLEKIENELKLLNTQLS